MKNPVSHYFSRSILALTFLFALNGLATESREGLVEYQLSGKKAEDMATKLYLDVTGEDFLCENKKLQLFIISNHSYHCGLVTLPNGKESYSCLYYKKSGKVVATKLPLALESLCDKTPPVPQHTISGFGHGVGDLDGNDNNPDISIDIDPNLKIDEDLLSPGEIEDLLKILGEDHWLKLLKDRMQVEVQ